MKTRFTSFFAKATIALLFVMLAPPTAAWAVSLGVNYIDANGVLQNTKTDGIDGNDEPTVLTNSTDVSNLDAGWYVVNGNVSYNNTLYCNGDMHLILADGAKLTVTVTEGRAIMVGDGATYPVTYGHLTIYAQSTGSNMGQLEATTTANNYSCIYAYGYMTILGGKVTASSSDPFSISAQYDIAIRGGEVTASNGISSLGGITISGGKVTATTSVSPWIAIEAEEAITLGLSNATDFISFSGINSWSSISIAEGQSLYVNDTEYTGTLSDEQIAALAGKVLTQAGTGTGWAGSGTEEAPYLITCPTQLNLLAQRVNGGNDYQNTYFQLANDITYAHTTAWNNASSTENNYTAIGCRIDYDTYHTFKGHFDGNGKTISGIRIYKGSNDLSDCYQGLFGIISSTAEVKNVTLADARITGFGNTGGIVGWIEVLNEGDNGSVCNCHVLSNVTIHAVHDHTDSHGGIVGSNLGSVTGCTSAASITIANGLTGCVNFGGIVGYNYGTVTDCLYLGTTLSGNLWVGAIVGYNSKKVKNCYYTSTTITGKDQSGNEIANASCAVGFNTSTVTNCGLAQNTITLGTGVVLTNATEYTFNGTGLTGYGDFALSYNDGTTTNIYALAGATVTVNYNGGAIPANTFWKVTYIDGNYEEKDVTVTDNQNGTYSFTMPAYNVTAAVYKDFTQCTAYVPDPVYHQGYYHGYFYDGSWNENHGGIKVWDPEGNLLTYYHYDETAGEMVGDYRYSTMESLDGGNCENKGENCRVILVGCGEWAGQLTAGVVIIAPGEDSGTWGTNLSWSYDGNGKLTITGTGAMNEANSYDAYPWYTYHSVITSVVIGEGITSVAASAFGGNQNAIVYGDLSTVSLPSTLESIGDNAFAYCTALTINLDDILTNTKVTLDNISTVSPFNQVGKFIGTLYDNADNAQVFDMMVSAQKAKVTIKGRTLYKDGKWNTLCLPFNMSAAEIAASQLTGATIKELDVTGIYDNKQTGLDGSTLNLYFKDATSIEAGVPYLIKWAGDGTNNITADLVFDDVKVYGPMHDVTSQDNKVTFKGTYAKRTFDTENTSILFVGGDNLYWPEPDLTDQSNPRYPSIGAFRAYFELGSSQQEVSAINLNFDSGEATGISEMRNEWNEGNERNVNEEMTNGSAWYDLRGRKLQGQPTTKGIYIVNGKKVVVK